MRKNCYFISSILILLSSIFIVYGMKDIHIKVASYNISCGTYVDLDFQKLATEIKKCDADIIGLQEVAINTSRVNGLDTLKLLAKYSGYKYYKFCKIINILGGEYGTAILSKYPIISFEIIDLPNVSGEEKRAISHAVIYKKGVRLNYFNTHINNRNVSLQEAQFDKIAEVINVQDRVIMTGDFNYEKLDFFEKFNNVQIVNNERYITYNPSKRKLDNIVCGQEFELIDSGVFENIGNSDHSLLWAEIVFNR